MRYVIAGALSIVLAILDLPWDRLRSYWSWSRLRAAAAGLFYVLAAAAVGLGAAAISGGGSVQGDGTRELVAAAWQGLTGHALLRVSRSSRGKRSDAAHLLGKIRTRIYEYLDSAAAEPMLDVLTSKDDGGLTAIALDLLTIARRGTTLSDRRRREIGELEQALEKFRSGGPDVNYSRRNLRSIIHAEAMIQGMTKRRMRGLA